MQIIIPMTGYGSRFVAAGYQELKPFIRVQGRPILEWIVKGMYPGESNFLFICRGGASEKYKGDGRNALPNRSWCGNICH